MSDKVQHLKYQVVGTQVVADGQAATATSPATNMPLTAVAFCQETAGTVLIVDGYGNDRTMNLVEGVWHYMAVRSIRAGSTATGIQLGFAPE